MSEFESYSFSRLYLDENIEFFLVIGVNDADDFSNEWDGRLLEVIGYAVIFTDKIKGGQRNFLYLIDKRDREFDDAIKYTRKFIDQMSLSEILNDRENLKIIKTDIRADFLEPPYAEFVRKVIGNDIDVKLFGAN